MILEGIRGPIMSARTDKRVLSVYWNILVKSILDLIFNSKLKVGTYLLKCSHFTNHF
jgi:hypothetical protein